MSKKHTIIFDGNYFFHKTLYVLPNESKGKLLESKNDQSTFIGKLALDFAAEIRRFKPILKRIVFVIDSSSWRKDFYPEQAYKGNRVPSDNIDWSSFYNCIDEFSTILKNKGMIIHRVPGAEGDDLVFAWSKALNLEGDNVIIVSGDGDLMQLVDYNESTKAHTIFYTKNRMSKKIVGYPGFIDWLKSDISNEITNIFEMNQTIHGDNITKTLLKDLVKKHQLQTITVNSNEFIFKKILSGDAGDNIKSVYWYEKNGRRYGVSDKKADRVWDVLTEKHKDFKSIYLFDKSYREEVAKIIIHELNATKMTYQDILNNIENNTMLIMLHSRAIPQQIQQQMFKDIEVFSKLQQDINNFVTKESILKDTEHVNNVFVPSQFNFFKDDEEDNFDIKDIISDNSLF